MAQVINTNSLSLLTQNNLNKSQSSLSSAIERLSSGLRINSAKDDAAGQAIANRFTSNIKGLTQASRNANDGISVAQTTEGALSEINNNLQRVRELTVQASTGTNSDSDLTSIQAEIEQRLSEIDRVSGQTQFNGVKVLAADNSLKIQVGANDGETISIDLKKIDTNSLSLGDFKVTGAEKATADSLVSKFGAKGTNHYTNGANTYSVDIGGTDVKNAGGQSMYVDAVTGAYVTAPTKANTASADFTKTVDQNTSAEELAVLAAGKNAGDKFTYKGTEFTAGTVNADGNGTLTTSIDGEKVTFTLASSTDATTGANATVVVDKDLYTAVGSGVLTTKANTDNKALTESTLQKANGFTKTADLQVGGANYTVDAAGVVTNAAGDQMYIGKDNNGKDALLTAAAAQTDQKTSNPLAVIDKALAQVDALRSDLGAVQNRFDSAITNLGNTVNNLSSARSRIEDADYATEVSNMSRAQILQQAGTSVLAQANQTSQNVLSLLR
ncbi:TPA: flagellin FliC [Citrobacter braakii]|uniref:flagellin N-terminal helical domain-containing protein n=1 Tax=Citrobacter braakii TaxID=57706 RepID=UPI003D99D672|nr:flagellin FliC [Citrobacter braakii]